MYGFLERAGVIAAAESLARRHPHLRADEGRGREHERDHKCAHRATDDTAPPV